MKSRPSLSATYEGHLQKAGEECEIFDVKALHDLLDTFRRINCCVFTSLPIFFVLDYRAQEYLLMSDSIQKISGYHTGEFLETHLDKLREVFHKKDFQVFNEKVFPFISKFLTAHLPEKQSSYVFSYNFRFEGSSKQYINVMQRCMYITSQQTGMPLYSVGALTDITHFKTDEVIVLTIEEVTEAGRLKVVERNYFYPDEIGLLLTTREKDILLYLADGYSTKEIANRLRISENTVDNHRQNMLRKTNSRNIAQLVSFTIRSKII